MAAAAPGAPGMRHRLVRPTPSPNQAEMRRFGCAQKRCCMLKWRGLDAGRLANQWNASTYKAYARIIGTAMRRSRPIDTAVQRPTMSAVSWPTGMCHTRCGIDVSGSRLYCVVTPMNPTPPCLLPARAGRRTESAQANRMRQAIATCAVATGVYRRQDWGC
eukprot:scaffold119047_cov37-Tisochrysis_lutea.AAC.2